jgi:predicted nucleic acid-binding protein
MYIQEQIKNNKFELVWSYMLDLENELNPNKGKKEIIAKWKDLSIICIMENDNIIGTIEWLEKHSIQGKDAVHLACAKIGAVDFFITTDYKLINKCKRITFIPVINPIDFIKDKEAIYKNN